MATFTWGSSVPNTGALKNSEISEKIFMAAVAECVIAEHATPEPSIGKGRGESVTLTRISNLSEPTDAALTETERVPERNHQVTGKVITMGEFGEAVPVTNLAKTFATFNLQDSIQKKLKDNMRLAMDTRAARAFKQGMLKYVPTGISTATLTTNGTAGAAALANMNTFHAEQIRDLLYDTYKAPFADNSCYIGIFRTLGLRGIKRDPDFEKWHQYIDPQVKFNSEVGKFEQIRFIESNHGGSSVTGFGLNIVGTGSVLGEGIIFGEDAVRFVEAMTPHLVVGETQDFQRSQAVAWLGIYEYGIVWDTANAGESRIIHVTSNV